MSVFETCYLMLLLSTEPKILRESGLKSSKVFSVLRPKKIRPGLNRLM
jgi:hypothetical protein